MGKAKKKVAGSLIKKILLGSAGLTAGALIIVGAITVVQKGKSMLGESNPSGKSIWKGISSLGNVFGGGVSGIYKCDESFFDQLEFRSDGTGFASMMGTESVFNYKVEGDRLIISSGGNATAYKIVNGQIVLPMNGRCSKKS